MHPSFSAIYLAPRLRSCFCVAQRDTILGLCLCLAQRDTVLSFCLCLPQRDTVLSFCICLAQRDTVLSFCLWVPQRFTAAINASFSEPALAAEGATRRALEFLQQSLAPRLRSCFCVAQRDTILSLCLCLPQRDTVLSLCLCLPQRDTVLSFCICLAQRNTVLSFCLWVAQRFTAAINASFSEPALAAEGATRRAPEFSAIYLAPANVTGQHKIKVRHRSSTAHERARYRCFLPDLAGLAGKRRAEPMPD